MSKPTPWSLGDAAPEPAVWEDAKPLEDVAPSETHTGTDPHGRAIGPAEDHTKPKRDSDGLTVPEAAKKREAAAKKAAAAKK